MLRAIDDLSRNLADKVPDLPNAPPPTFLARVGRNGLDRDEPREGITLAAMPATPDRYRLQVAAFSKPDEARHAVQLLRNEGFQPTIVVATQSEKAWHKVMLGPFSSLDAAQEVGVRVQKRLPFSPMVVRSAAQ
jgi:cell division septation protein DedD